MTSENNNITDKSIEHNDGIAIIGMSGFFPQSNSLEDFCQKLEQQESLFTKVPLNHFPDESVKERYGAFIKAIDHFDAAAFNILPAEAEYIDPRQRLLLMSVWHTLEDACYLPSSFKNKIVDVFVASEGSPYVSVVAHAELSPYIPTGISSWALANRISHCFQFKGKSLFLDAGCAGSSFGLHEAMQSLRNNQSEYAIVGGANLLFAGAIAGGYVSQETLGILGDAKTCQPFQNNAIGFLPAESVVTVLLKRYKDALRDGDNIHGVLLGSSVNHAGGYGSMTMPSADAQSDAMVNAYRDAKIDPSTIGYIEAHAGSSLLIDAEEIKAFKMGDDKLAKLAKFRDDLTCKISTLKPNMGHANSASGLVALVRIIHSMKIGKKLGIKDFGETSDQINLDGSRFYLSEKTEPWNRIRQIDGIELPRRAAINNIGAGGVNAHLVVEEFRPKWQAPNSLKPQKQLNCFLALSALSKEQLTEYVRSIFGFIKNRPNLCAEQLEHLYITARKNLRFRIVFQYASLNDLIGKLSKFLKTKGKRGYCFSNDTKSKSSTSKIFQKYPKLNDYLNSLQDGSDKAILFELWSSGNEGPVNNFFIQKKQPKISLPYYPFNIQPYWITPVCKQASMQQFHGSNPTNNTAQVNTTLIHPLLQQNTSKLNQQSYRTILQGNESFLAQGCAQKTVRFVVLEMTRAAIVDARPKSKYQETLQLRQLEWSIQLHELTFPLALDIQLISQSNNSLLFKIKADSVVICQGEANWHQLPRPITLQQTQDLACDNNIGVDLIVGINWEEAKTLPGLEGVKCDFHQLDANQILLKIASNPDPQGIELAPKLIDDLIITITTLTDYWQPTQLETISISAIQSIKYHHNCGSEIFVRLQVTDTPQQLDKAINIDAFAEDGTLYWQLFGLNLCTSEIDKPVVEVVNSPDVLSSAALQDTILDSLVQLFVDITKLSKKNIDVEASLETYGIDSLMIVQLNTKLAAIFNDLSKTVFFECLTLQSLSEYLVELHPQECQIWSGSTTSESIAINSPDTKSQVIKNIPVSLKPIRHNRHDYRPNENSDIAIIGIHGRYPQAESLDEFWRNLAAGKDCISEIPAERWSLAGFYHADIETALERGKSYSKWGGFIDGFADFDPYFFNITPREATNMDPQERIFLQSCWAVIENAGYTRSRLSKQHDNQVGVFAGITKTGFELHGPDLWREGHALFPFTSFSSVANRVSYLFNFNGPSMPIDTMCSASLTAIHEACEHIKRGECELAIAGGVNLYLHPISYIGMCAKQMLSQDGKCKSFGAGGNGFVPGEGVGTVLLKKLSQASQDGDRILAIIRGTSVNHGGKTNGYTVPNPLAQAELISRSLEKANIDPKTISYIEAHGTGTELGDPVEMSGLIKAFKNTRIANQELQYCALGSVKSNIGHLEAAAGIAGLTKIILQMQHRQLVPSLHSKDLNPNINFSTSPFKVQQKLEPWKTPQILIDGELTMLPRRAGLSSFGAGGSNAHIIVEEYQQPSRENQKMVMVNKDNPVIIVLSAKSAEQLNMQALQLYLWLLAEPSDLASIAYTLQIGRETMEERIALIATSHEDLLEKLNDFVEQGKVVVDSNTAMRQSITNENEVISEKNISENDVIKWIEHKDYLSLIAAWNNGVKVEWGLLYGNVNLPTVDLPNYPFEKHTFWLPVIDHEDKIFKALQLGGLSIEKACDAI